MDKETLDALKNSIEHWKRMFEFRNVNQFSGERPSASSCALCRKFYVCRDCPVAIMTSTKCCLKTPYQNAYFAYNTSRIAPTKRNWNTWRVCCIREINFLESLLPKES